MRPPRHAAWPRQLVAAAALFATAIGVTTLVGWAFDLPRLTDLWNAGISMFPNAAACAVASGLALLLRGLPDRRWRAGAAWLGAAVALVGGLTLAEHLTGIDLGIDTLLLVRRWGQAAAAAPMRIGLPASTSFVLIGAALMLLDRGAGSRGAAAACGMAVIAISMLSLIGYLYGAQQMYTIPWLTGIAMQTALMLLALGLGVVASVPDREPMRTALEPGAAGILVRRALPIVVGCALLIGWIRVSLQDRGIVDTALGTALRTVVEIALLAVLLWWAAARVRTQERALRESEAEGRRQANELETLVDSAAIAMHRVGPDGTILWANDAELQMLGYARDEYVGHRIAEFHADPGAIADILARLGRGERLREYPARLRCKDGALKSVLIDSSVLWDEGRFVHTQCFTRDVTERERAEEARALLAAIVEATDDAVVSKTLDGIVTSWNAGATRIFGYEAAEMIGRPIEVIIPHDRLEEEQDILRRLRRGESIDHFDTMRRAKDGRMVDVSLTISPVRDESGRIIGASKIARDVTDRKRAEVERAEGDRRKDEFIAILGHELRNPLAPVRNAARYLKLRGPADPDLQRPVDIIERQVTQMSRLIDDLLDVSRISRGTLELRREHVTSAEIVEAAVEACRDDDRREGTPPAPAHANRAGRAARGPRAARAGALQPHRQRGQIHTRGWRHRDHGRRHDERLAHRLRQGHRVGHPAGQAHGDLRSVRARGAAARTPGRPWHRADAGPPARGAARRKDRSPERRHRAGQRVPPDAPHRRPGQPSSRRRPPPCREGAPLCILVADDSPDAVESLVLLLELAGHQVHGAADGEAAIDAIQRLRPDVALLDIGMPKANGYQVAQRIREHAWGGGIYLVALTGWGQQADKDRTRGAGFDAHW